MEEMVLNSTEFQRQGFRFWGFSHSPLLSGYWEKNIKKKRNLKIIRKTAANYQRWPVSV